MRRQQEELYNLQGAMLNSGKLKINHPGGQTSTDAAMNGQLNKSLARAVIRLGARVSALESKVDDLTVAIQDLTGLAEMFKGARQPNPGDRQPSHAQFAPPRRTHCLPSARTLSPFHPHASAQDPGRLVSPVAVPPVCRLPDDSAERLAQRNAAAQD